MTSKVPPRKLYHENWKRGFIQNSPHGNDIAKSRGDTWVDNDFHLSADLAWANMHGWPEETWGPGKPETWTWAVLSRKRHTYANRTYQLRDFATAIRDASARHQGMEAEIKDLRPIPVLSGDGDVIRGCLERMRSHAIAAWGPKWREHLNLKIVSTMAGGLDHYALPIARIAGELGIPVLITARGKDRLRKVWPSYVTYVRNSLRKVRS